MYVLSHTHILRWYVSKANLENMEKNLNSMDKGKQNFLNY